MFKGHVATEPLTGQKVNTTRRGFKTRQEAQQAHKKTILLDMKTLVILNNWRIQQRTE